MSTIDDIRARWAAATRGPWAWRGNKDSKTIDLLSARSAWGDCCFNTAEGPTGPAARHRTCSPWWRSAPLRYHEMRCYCHHCGAQLPDGNGGHEADCAWVLACDLVAGEAVRP
jgi:hypothetical protein